MTTCLTLVHAMSPVHAGTGQSVGAIDLPIARERPTGIPLVPGSSIKGALRARSFARGEAAKQITRDVFGPETAESSEHAGSVQFSDVQLLLLPVRSVRGTFAWVTSRFLLQRFARNAKEAGVELGALPGQPQEGGCVVVGQTLTVPAGKVVFEDLDFTVEPGQGAALGAFVEKLGKLLFPDGSTDAEEWRNSLRNRICLIHDDMMAFLLETGTEVSAHIRLDEDTKTVAQGALWYQESLPAESVLTGIVVASSVNAANGRSKREAVELIDHVKDLAKGIVQLGGKATVGQGSCFVHIAGGGA
jgi:CRISPR-associated protein Cmr4